MTGLRDAFKVIRRALEGAGVAYAIGGSWASTTYGEPRQTNDIDLIAKFTPATLDLFLGLLEGAFYYDRDTAHEALRIGRAFNAIHRQWSFKFDLFPVVNEHGFAELDRRQSVTVPRWMMTPAPVVSAEDIVIAKLRWYRSGGSVSQRQWRDILGVLRLEGERMDSAYLESWTRKLGLHELYLRARNEARDL